MLYILRMGLWQNEFPAIKGIDDTIAEMDTVRIWITVGETRVVILARRTDPPLDQHEIDVVVIIEAKTLCTWLLMKTQVFARTTENVTLVRHRLQSISGTIVQLMDG